jgi:hypothetical protein
MHTQRLEFNVKALAETLDIRLGAAVVRHIGKTFMCAHRSHKQQSALAASRELSAEVMGDVEMR